MNKLQNASNNLEEMCQGAIDGKQLQASADGESNWVNKKPESLFYCLTWHWRIKPDVFEDAYKDWLDDGDGYSDEKEIAKYFWDAAIAHKESESD